ncbi:hypothetical protein LC607_08215 [Nostoc sp. CHAB 5824]|nr:hypothetical protein [Nostoc sp. CHAB 5824]
MKAAFHFNAFHPSLSSNYGNNVEKLLFNILLSSRNLDLSSKILTGDLLLSNLAYDVIKTSEKTETRKFNQDKYFKNVTRWLKPENTIWSSMIIDRLMLALKDEIFIICFETIEMQLANYLDGQLREISEAYLGAMEVDDGSHIHWNLYSNSIGVRYRINNKTASVFWDSTCEESQDESTIERLKLIGFKQVSFENLNGRYTIFDEYHDFEHARRVAEWKKQCGNLLAFIADGVAHRIGDTVPDLGDKLWAALKTFTEAETNEEFAQVTASCRRIVEHVSDELFPPIDGEIEGRKLGTKQYRNRLLAFVDETRKSDTNIDLI